MPRRDGPYVIFTQRSPSSYEIASLDNPGEPLRVYHTSALTPCSNDKVKPLIHLRKRGRPPKVPHTPGSSSGRRRNQRGRIPLNPYVLYFVNHMLRKRTCEWDALAVWSACRQGEHLSWGNSRWPCQV
ncbi:uncharacterized protein TNCV_4635481 [Trichonephila clavipes]|nr:uncharacterized protein TNCV_4635481 [Trichonephila clavipes]